MVVGCGGVQGASSRLQTTVVLSFFLVSSSSNLAWKRVMSDDEILVSTKGRFLQKQNSFFLG